MVNITVQYRDGGEDKFYNVEGSSCKDGVLTIEVTSRVTVNIILSAITFFKVEEVKNEKDTKSV